ncbi:MAG: hypothetical protein ACR2HY_06450 [Acidimicrobiales bacterium]
MTTTRFPFKVRSLRFLVALVLPIGTLLLLPISATAATANSAPADIVTISATSGSASATQGVAAATITCTVKANDPHQSTHVPTNVNVVGTTKCTAPMTALTMTVNLFNDGRLVGTNTKANAGKAAILVNAAVHCVSGTYNGTATATLVFPPGFLPSPQVVNVTSRFAPITC